MLRNLLGTSASHFQLLERKFSDTYQDWRIFADFPMSHRPQEARPHIPTDEHELPPQHLKGCLLEIKKSNNNQTLRSPNKKQI